MKRLLLMLVLTCTIAPSASHSVILKWSDGVNPTGTTYNIYRASQACVAGVALAKINSSPVAALTWTDPTPVQNTTYCYSVRAYLNTVESIDSNLATAVIPADLFAPTGLSLVIK